MRGNSYAGGVNDTQLPTETVAPAAPWPARDADWHRVSPKYAWADLIINLAWTIVIAAGFAAVYLTQLRDIQSIWRAIILIAGCAIIAIMLVSSVFAFRRVRAIGYLLREDDFVFRRGIMFERIVAVPYGRLQLVDVNRGPLLRALGLSTLKFVTASATTGVQLPGLVEADAEALRDRLIELAETRRSGL